MGKTFLILSGCLSSKLLGQGLEVELVEIKTAGNESGFQKQTVQASSSGPGIGAVPLDAAESTLGLDRAVHAQQGAMDAVEVGKNLLMEAGQFLVEADSAGCPWPWNIFPYRDCRNSLRTDKVLLFCHSGCP